MTTTPPQPGTPAASGKKASSISPLLLGCVIVPLVLLCLLAVGAVLGWRSFVSYGIASDFTEYQAKIRPMELDPEVKRPLLERMEKLREKGRTSPISFWKWVDYNSSIRSLLEDGKLTPDELEALNRELDRMEAEFR